MNSKQIAEAFSGHRVPEVYDHPAPSVRWSLPGQATLEGKEALVDACEQSSAEMAQLAGTEFVSFVSVAEPTVAAVDAVGRYFGSDGSCTTVSSADVYEFDADGLVVRITSYAVELAS